MKNASEMRRALNEAMRRHDNNRAYSVSNLSHITQRRPQDNHSCGRRLFQRFANGYKWFSTLRLVTLLLKLPARRKGKTSVR